jgi:HD domain-containing protein
MRPTPVLPATIGRVPIPQDDVSRATWTWAQRSLPRYLLGHSIRTYCWGATIADHEGWAFDDQILWTSSLLHDGALRRLPRNTMCFEIEGAEFARRFLEQHGLGAEAAERAAIAIILHMRAGVTLEDGVESVLLDRATGLDVRGDGYELVDDVRTAVMRDQPRGDFDRRFLDAIRREASSRPTCQSARLLHETDLAGWMARSPWRQT